MQTSWAKPMSRKFMKIGSVYQKGKCSIQNSKSRMQNWPKQRFRPVNNFFVIMNEQNVIKYIMFRWAFCHYYIIMGIQSSKILCPHGHFVIKDILSRGIMSKRHLVRGQNILQGILTINQPNHTEPLSILDFQIYQFFSKNDLPKYFIAFLLTNNMKIEKFFSYF